MLIPLALLITAASAATEISWNRGGRDVASIGTVPSRDGERLPCGCHSEDIGVGSFVRVVSSSHDGPAIGTQGFVCAFSFSSLLVEFDGWHNGHSGDCGFAVCGSCRESGNSRWWFGCEDVVMVSGRGPVESGNVTLGFAVTSGECTLDGTCAMSPNYPSNYGANQECYLRALSREAVSATTFQTEGCCDSLTIPGDSTYAGESTAYGPEFALVLEGGEIHWRSDFNIERSGWRICASPAAPAPVPDLGAPPTFAVVSGGCTISSNASCAKSPNFPSHYGNDQRCRLELLNSDGIISTGQFHTELDFDYLTFGSGDRFSGSHGPNKEYTGIGEGILWISDFSTSHSGWEICVTEPPPSSPPSGLFNVTFGDCTLVGDCVLSPHFPLAYSNDQECRIRANADGLLTTVAFHLESRYDYLGIAGTHFTGDAGPEGMYILNGMTMHFSSDFSNTRQGFMICLRPKAPEHVTPNPPQAAARLGSIYCEHGCADLTMAGDPTGLIISSNTAASADASAGAGVSIQGQCDVIFTQVNLGEAGLLVLDGRLVSQARSTLLGGGHHSLTWSGGGDWLAIVLPTIGGCDDFSVGFESGCGRSTPSQKLFSTDSIQDSERCRAECLDYATSHVSSFCCEFGFSGGEMGCFVEPGGAISRDASALGRAALCSPQRPLAGGVGANIVTLVEARASEAELAYAATKLAPKPLPKQLASRPRPTAKEEPSGMALASGTGIWLALAALAFFSAAVALLKVRSRSNATTGEVGNPLLGAA